MSEVTNSFDLPDVVMPSCGVHKVLRGQKALVTGANSGIGRAVAIAMGQAGSDVVVNYVRDEAQANEVVEEIRGAGSEAYAHKCDVSDPGRGHICCDARAFRDNRHTGQQRWPAERRAL